MNAHAKTPVGRKLVMEGRELISKGVADILLKPPGFDDFIAKVVAEENANGIAFNVQIVAE